MYFFEHLSILKSSWLCGNRHLEEAALRRGSVIRRSLSALAVNIQLVLVKASQKESVGKTPHKMIRTFEQKLKHFEMVSYNNVHHFWVPNFWV